MSLQRSVAAPTAELTAGTAGSAVRVTPLRSRGAELRAARPDRAEALVQSRPRPRLELLVATGRLAARRLQVLEPCICLFDLQQLERFARYGHRRHLLSG